MSLQCLRKQQRLLLGFNSSIFFAPVFSCNVLLSPYLCFISFLYLELYVIGALSSTGSTLSNTDLSDLSTVGTCDIFVYQMRHRVM